MLNDFDTFRSLNWKAPFEVIEANTDHGKIGMGGDLGFDEGVVTNSEGFRYAISAHANSRIVIKCYTSLVVRGFLNGTADFCAGVNYFVDGVLIGKLVSPFDTTDKIIFHPGLHVLEATHEGDLHHCHSVWGFNDLGDNLVDPLYFLSMGAVCKDENDYLEDWIRHHLVLGLEHFFIIDHNSKIPLSKTIEDAGLKEFVTVEISPDWGGLDPQIAGYKYIIEKYGCLSKWMAFFDPDEFLVPKINASIKRMLFAYENYGGVKIRWIMFGSDGLKRRPVEQLEAYTLSYENHHVKCIVQPRFVLEVHDPHWFSFMHGRPAVGECFGETASSRTIQLNHYWTRSEEEWIRKMNRGTLGNIRIWEDFLDHDLLCKYRDHSILKLRCRLDAREEISFEPRIAGFIHIAAVNHWKSILLSQLSKLKSSGLYDRTLKIYLGIVGGDSSSVEYVKGLSEKFSIVCCDLPIEDYEFPTLKALEAYCQNSPSDFVWYIHSKGAVNADDFRTRWREKMEGFVICNFEIAIDRLKFGYGAAGGFGATDYRWPIPGNFWWARADFINALPRISTLDPMDRWQAEGWIGKLGADFIYWDDSGDTIFRTFKIITFQVGVGIISTNGFHMWLDNGFHSFLPMPVRLPDDWKRDYLISVHAPSFLLIKCLSPLIVFGFMAETSERGDWIVEFLIDGLSIGRFGAALDRTSNIELAPGDHTLETRVVLGGMWGAHSTWGVVEDKQT